ncbi:MAG: hypothetical protein HUU50_02960 [Candidatus Brocadiae bacterium]|nr:hypothetical protein [Candidatus Brocadiia bacterium]
MESQENILAEYSLQVMDDFQAFIKKNSLDFFSMSIEDFSLWLQKQVTRQSTDLDFAKRSEIRDLHSQYRNQFYPLWGALKKAQSEWQGSGKRLAWEFLEKKILGSQKAIEGLSQAIEKKMGEKRLECIAKLELYQKDLECLKKEQKIMLDSLAEKHALDKAEKELWNFKEKIGLNQKEKELEDILYAQAQRTTSAGANFEALSREAIEKHIIPSVAKNLTKEQKASLRILSNVTLGCARAEIDYLVVLPDEKNTRVLAIIEVKRNINDIAWGFLIKQENIAWFTGDVNAYSAESYRTHIFQEGHFNKVVYHEEEGKRLSFDQSSFAAFKREGKYFIDDLFFITDARPLLGMLSSDYRKFIYRISTDMNFDLENKEYLQDLLAWIRSFISPIQTRNILELYATRETWAKQIVFFSRKKL